MLCAIKDQKAIELLARERSRGRFYLKRVLIVAGLAAVLAGCGGSGGGSSSLPTGSSSRVSLFITDSMDGNDHVWVTVKSVDLVGAGGTTNVYSDATGKTVDLKTLRDSQGARFEFLNRDSVPAGTYTGAKVTLAHDLVVFPHLASTGTNMTFAPQYDDGAGNSAITFNFPKPRTVTGDSEDLVIDFDLANWDETGNVVTVSLKEGSKQGLENPDRHEDIHYAGTVTGLAGASPDFTFTLFHGNQAGFPVSTSADTHFFQTDGAEAVVAEGKHVVVEGHWDQVTGKLVAKSVRVLTAEDEQGEQAQAEGPVTEFSLAGGFVRINTDEAEGFVPTNNTVRLEFTDGTKFLGDDGQTFTKDQFFALLAKGAKVEAEGSYNPAMGVLTAEHVRLDDASGDDNGGSTGGGATSGGSTAGGDTGSTTGGDTGSTTGGETGSTTGGDTGTTTGGETGSTTGGETGSTTTGGSL